MTRHNLVRPWALGLCAFALGCAGEAAAQSADAPDTGPSERDARQVTRLTAALTPVVRGHNAFALDLYSQLATEKGGNLFVSPLSIEAALAIVERGAAGQTAEEFKRALHIGDDEPSYHREFGRLLRDLSGAHAGRGYELNLANGVFLDRQFAAKPRYSTQVDEDYGAEVSAVTFSEPEALNTVNDWVKAQTQGLVPTLFEQFDPLTVMAVANAIYFKGEWATGFDPEETRDRDFWLSADDPKPVPTMSLNAESKCAGDSAVRVVELDYKDNELSMLLLVPGDATDLFAASEYSPLATLEAELDVQTLDAFIADLSPCEVRLSLPQFRAASSLDLQASLKQLGIRQAFDSNAADFSRLTDESVFVGQAVHRAYIEIDESGTRAAAATGATIAGKSAGPQLPTIAFDQPFVFLIRDKLTESILFMGRVTDPTATGE